MRLVTCKTIFACLWYVTGIAFAPDLNAQTSDILNRLESYASATSQLVFNDAYTCSGVLINNTQDQGRPLVLTAAHCIENEEDLESVVVVFGKRKLLQGQPYNGLEWNSNGASLLSMSRELDFALLELKDRIPIHVSPVFLGWNKRISQPALIYSIHSPDFGYAQYSFSMAKPSLATFGGLYKTIDFGHWKVDQWTREPTTLGSSGAPLLNANFEIIGGLSGSTDWKNYKSDYFFRFDLAYDHFSDTASQLKAWVDPAKAGSIGNYQPARKIRNYNFINDAIRTIKLVNGTILSEEFSLDDDVQINGVYVVIDEISDCSGSIITVSLSQNDSEPGAVETDVCGLTQYSENYIPFDLPARVSGKFSVSVNFQSTGSSAHITIPETEMAHLTSYFFAVNSNNPSTGSPPDSPDG
jgi:V8-like Glu-specific endopeptidase